MHPFNTHSSIHLNTFLDSLLCLDWSFVIRNMQYIDRETHEDFHLLHSYPEALSKKVTLLKYFRNYMSEHLLKVRTPCTAQLESGSNSINSLTLA